MGEPAKRWYRSRGWWLRFALVLILVGLPVGVVLNRYPDRVIAAVFWLRHPAQWVTFRGVRFRVPRGWDRGEPALDGRLLIFSRPSEQSASSKYEFKSDSLYVGAVATSPLPQMVAERQREQPAEVEDSWSEDLLIGAEKVTVTYSTIQGGESQAGGIIASADFHGLWFSYAGREVGQADFRELLQSCELVKIVDEDSN